MSKDTPLFPCVVSNRHSVTTTMKVPIELGREAVNKHRKHLSQAQHKPECTLMTSPDSKLKQRLGQEGSLHCGLVCIAKIFLYLSWALEKCLFKYEIKNLFYSPKCFLHIFLAILLTENAGCNLNMKFNYKRIRKQWERDKLKTELWTWVPAPLLESCRL